MACIVLILSLSGGLQQLIASQVSGENGNTLVVRPESNRGANDKNFLALIGSSQTYARSSLTTADATSISKVQDVVSVAPLAVTENNLKGDYEAPASKLVASTAELEKIVNLPLETGQFIDDGSGHNQVVLGFKLSQRLFNSTETIGETVKVKDTTFLVVGVLQQLNLPVNYNDVDFDESAIVSIKQAAKINDNLQIQQINVKVKNQAALSTVSSQVDQLLLKNHHGEPDFSVLSGGEVSNSTKRLFDTITAILSLVAGVSLVVGGIGVMNIMLVSVSERTREIGIRKAVGATNTNILVQFLCEAFILSLAGGLLGLLFGYAFAFGASGMMPFQPAVSPSIIGLSIAISVGLSCVFGIFPALRAASKDPIDSLRHYH
jgi:putative ABC transport system permease protein